MSDEKGFFDSALHVGALVVAYLGYVETRFRMAANDRKLISEGMVRDIVAQETAAIREAQKDIHIKIDKIYDIVTDLRVNVAGQIGNTKGGNNHGPMAD